MPVVLPGSSNPQAAGAGLRSLLKRPAHLFMAAGQGAVRQSQKPDLRLRSQRGNGVAQFAFPDPGQLLGCMGFRSGMGRFACRRNNDVDACSRSCKCCDQSARTQCLVVGVCREHHQPFRKAGQQRLQFRGVRQSLKPQCLVLAGIVVSEAHHGSDSRASSMPPKAA